jgi:polyhydroxyalkanoate synthesis regulator phasin
MTADSTDAIGEFTNLINQEGEMGKTIKKQIEDVMDRIEAGGLSEQEEVAALQELIELKRKQQRRLPRTQPHMPRAWIENPSGI